VVVDDDVVVMASVVDVEEEVVEVLADVVDVAAVVSTDVAAWLVIAGDEVGVAACSEEHASKSCEATSSADQHRCVSLTPLNSA
jgi:hypothetical protein